MLSACLVISNNILDTVGMPDWQRQIITHCPRWGHLTAGFPPIPTSFLRKLMLPGNDEEEHRVLTMPLNFDGKCR